MGYKVYGIPYCSIRLSSSDYEFAGKVFLPYRPRFLFNPAIQPNLTDPAEIIKFHVMRVLSSLVGRRCEKYAREIATVAAKRNTLGFDAIQRCTPFFRQMEMLAVFLTAPPAGDGFLRHTHFDMNKIGKFVREVILVKIAVEAVQSAGCR
jgi:hypothetical protein